MKDYTDKEIWDRVAESIDGMEYHGELADDEEYKADVTKRVREYLEDREDELIIYPADGESVETESDLTLGNAIDSALFCYWADNSGEYSV